MRNEACRRLRAKAPKQEGRQQGWETEGGVTADEKDSEMGSLRRF